jgi:hypothetical protein
MSGFLQRLCVAAIRPEPRLKPLVGSIYGGEPGIDAAEQRSSSLADPARAIHPQAPSRPAPGPIEARLTHAHEPSPGERTVYHAPLIATPAPFPPSLASVVSRLTTPKQAVAVAATYAPDYGRSEGTAAQSGTAVALPAQHSGRTEEHTQPLATPTPASRESQRHELRLAQFMPIAMHRELPQPAETIPQLAPTQKATQANTGEEVQIHIGRIEVIAVPPRGVATEPTSRSRATSLNDYLRRRNGGAG